MGGVLLRAYRRGVIGLTGIDTVERVARRLGPRLGISRFVAGDTVEDALAVAASLRADGLRVIFDLLGEFIESEEAAAAVAAKVINTLRRLTAEDTRHLSVKPSQIGLGLGAGSQLVAAGHAHRIVAAAAGIDGHVCFDMEDSPRVDGTLDVFHELHANHPRHVSTVLQSYLLRAPADLDRLLALYPSPSLRIVKGAYVEPSHIAHQDTEKIDKAFTRLVFTGLEAGAHIAIATHDESIIKQVETFLTKQTIGSDRYEFQLLHGIRRDLQKALVARGHAVRTYVPFGTDWYGYYSRRLAERPGNLGFLLRSLFR